MRATSSAPAAKPLLLYNFQTNPNPLQTGVTDSPSDPSTLTIVATNNTGSTVTLQGMIVKIPVGTGAAQLTAQASAIVPVPPSNWTLAQTDTPTGFIVYTFYPGKGSADVPNNTSLLFEFNSIGVNDTVGTCEIDVTEGSGNCKPPNCPVTPLYVTKFPSGWGEISFLASPPIIEQGSPTTLSWDGPQGATYTIEYYTPQTGIVNVPGPGQPPLSNQGSYPNPQQSPLSPSTNTTFYLNVSEVISGVEQTTSSQVTVTVVAPLVINSFGLSPGSLAAGGSTSLNWSTQSALTCELSVSGCSGSVSVGVGNETPAFCKVFTNDGSSLIFTTPDGTETYGTITLPSPCPTSVVITLTASNAAGSLTDTVSLTLVPCSIDSFTYTDEYADPSDIFTLYWSTSNAVNNYISGIGNVGASGSTECNQQSYTLTIYGFGGPISHTVNVG